MDDELYDIILQNVRQKLEDLVRGNLSVSRDERHLFIGVYRFGKWWNWKMFNMDFMDPDSLNSDFIVEKFIRDYKAFINDSYFR